MEQVVAAVDRRVDRTPLTALVAVGDVALIALFVTIGEISHNAPPWEFPVNAVKAFVPFLIGWTITAFVGGMYTSGAWEFPMRAISWTIPAWVTAVVLAMAIRITPVVPGGAAPTFVAVSIGVGLLLLVPWRIAIAVVDAR